ncbi:MAG: hypothetical protein EBZ59_06630, partial [Planctomycetia bacterium]|nr:hypothetical protein [Planctomycetia bacterium]
MATATFRSSRLPPPAGEQASNPARKWLALLALLAVLTSLLAWLLGWFRPAIDPRVAEIRKLQDEARQTIITGGGPSTIAEAAAGMAAMERIRQKIEALPEDLRPQVEQGGRGMFRAAMRARIDAYFALP